MGIMILEFGWDFVFMVTVMLEFGWEVVFMGIVMLEFFVWFWLLESGVYCVFVVFGYYYGVIGFYCGVYVYFCIFFGV